MAVCQFFRYVAFLSLLTLGFSCNKPVDIRTPYLKTSGLTEANVQKGKQLIQAMESACGGREQWLSHESASFIQLADWYGKKKISHWDTVPQRFQMTSILGSDDCEIKLLNGPSVGSQWEYSDGQTNVFDPNGQAIAGDHSTQKDKLLFKNYWFQFPFRIGEADIISYAGQATIGDKTYELVFASWGSAEANSNFDQFVLYLNPDTYFLEYLHFTVREKAAWAGLHAQFSDYQSVDEFYLAHSQFVRQGKPGREGVRLHENHYESIKMGENL